MVAAAGGLNEGDGRVQRLRKTIGYAAHLLPAQGPISVFVHHNTLHAYEYVPFEAAVTEAAGLFGCEPFLTEAEYRQELRNGRIEVSDLRDVLQQELGSRGEESIGTLVTRLEFQLGLLRHHVREVRGPALKWMLAETHAHTRWRRDLGISRSERNKSEEGTQVSRLWEGCLRAAASHVEDPAVPQRSRVRHRDVLLAATGADSDTLTHPVLIRLCAAFLDQGIASWSMPCRQRGLYQAFRRLYGHAGWTVESWMRPMAAELAEQSAGQDALQAVLDSLDRLGVTELEWEAFLTATLLALRGWAGMIRQIEVRPDRVPVHAPPALLVDFLAVRLTLERFALSYLAPDTLAWPGGLSELRAALTAELPQPTRPTTLERAWLLFEMAQIHGWGEEHVTGLDGYDVAALLQEYDRFDENERRRVMHLAYERHHRSQILDALCAHSKEQPVPLAAPLRFQTIHCIDEREESLRRHIEEVEPACETFGTAGFFGVAMYYRGIGDAHPTPLCPIAIRPQHEIEETVVEELHDELLRRHARRRWLARLTYETRLASRTFTRGALLSFAVGLGAAIPLIFRVLLPRWTARVRREASRLVRAPRRSRLVLERSERQVLFGQYAGFTVEEMTEIVGRVLVDLGLTQRFAPLVAVVGHGSSSLNNPHESAHDCGACGGGRGGPNARAFARMANDTRVRAALHIRGLEIPTTTYFVGTYHNSCDDAVTIFDTDEIPITHAADVARLCAVFEEARGRTAHERCRRFDSAPLSLSPRQALAHVEARCEDLAQPRPEYGHATNAVCIIGRRARTRGVFLDRRAFLVSYDPELDDAAGSILARVLAGVVPVAAGINLEYYFSRVDPAGYGCGTKLPHNITALLGVMDGHASDLRTGLPWQMVEIHEPVRLLVIVDARPDLLRRVVAHNDDLARLLQNRWLQMAAWSPGTSEISLFTRHGLVRHQLTATVLPRVPRSADWYGGQRGFLPCATIRGATQNGL